MSTPLETLSDAELEAESASAVKAQDIARVAAIEAERGRRSRARPAEAKTNWSPEMLQRLKQSSSKPQTAPSHPPKGGRVRRISFPVIFLATTVLLFRLNMPVLFKGIIAFFLAEMGTRVILQYTEREEEGDD